MNKKESVLAFAVLILTVLGCTESDQRNENSVDNSSSRQTSKPAAGVTKIDEYTIKGIRFVYFKIPGRLGDNELLETAQNLHQAEPDSQLVLVDDTSKVGDYIAYVKAVSGQGNLETVELPQEWADKHIVANVQKFTSGKFMLYRGNGYEEIGELK